MRNFWTDRWLYEKTPQDWVEYLVEDGTRYWSSTKFQYSSSFTRDLLEDALDKLVLEKKLKKDEAENLKKMISGTREDAYLALIVMAALKPKKFKKVLT